jgi:hypothetical protein
MAQETALLQVGGPQCRQGERHLCKWCCVRFLTLRLVLARLIFSQPFDQLIGEKWPLRPELSKISEWSAKWLCVPFAAASRCENG